MDKLRCMVVDDEPLAVKMIESFIERTDFMELSQSFTDSIAALDALKKDPVDVIFLDIQMPDLDGMTLAAMVPAETRIIFTTAFKDFAFDSYEVNALDFLLKPIRYNKFLAAAEKARQWFDMKNKKAETDVPAPTAKRNSIFLRVDGQIRQVPLDKILYVSGMKDYVMFYIEGEKRALVTHQTMKSVEEMLPTDMFMRVHRSYIIALDKIRTIDRNNCIYIGNEVIHVSEGYVDNFNKYVRMNIPGA